MKKRKSIETIEGLTTFNEDQSFMFSPYDPVSGTVPRFTRAGVVQQGSDGTVEFIPRAKRRSCSQLITKLDHGRVSATSDGCIQLTLKIDVDLTNLMEYLEVETAIALCAINNYLNEV